MSVIQFPVRSCTPFFDMCQSTLRHAEVMHETLSAIAARTGGLEACASASRYYVLIQRVQARLARSPMAKTVRG
jgi:hypothetical protein